MYHVYDILGHLLATVDELVGDGLTRLRSLSGLLVTPDFYPLESGPMAIHRRVGRRSTRPNGTFVLSRRHVLK